MVPDRQPASRRCYQFGPFVADCRKRLLWRENVVMPLTPKAFEILATLIETRGRVIEMDELVTRVWGHVAVEAATLARHISTLRRTLDERPEQHIYIVTVPGRGYEFVAGITELDDVPGEVQGVTEPDREAGVRDVGHQPVLPDDESGRSDGGSRWFPFVMASALAIVVAAGALVALEYRRSQL